MNSNWDSNDYQGFLMESNSNSGHIKDEQILSKYIKDLSSDKENKVLVEIGTWNGLGSTKFFIEGLLENRDAEFWTLENNLDKVNFAKKQWEKIIEENKLNVKFVHGSLISNEDIDEWMKIHRNDYTENDINCINIDKQNTTNIIELPFEKIDVLLIDGGFFGHLEYLLLKDKCKYILLDDTNHPKSKHSRKDLIESDD